MRSVVRKNDIQKRGRSLRKIAFYVLLFTTLVGLYQFGYLDNVQQRALGRANGIALLAGFAIKSVSISGQNRLAEREIVEALALDGRHSLLTFDAAAAQTRLQRYPWVKTAKIMRLLPDALQVVVEEYEPFARWRTGNEDLLIDRTGHVIARRDEDSGEFENLPLIVGAGAPPHAAGLLKLLVRHPRLNDRVIAAQRISTRRWTLKLRGGPDILLPAQNVGAALARLDRLQNSYDLLDRPLDAIDLRLADRVTLRLPAPAAGAQDLSDLSGKSGETRT